MKDNQSVSDVFWYDDPSILWRRDRLTEFFPTKDHTLEERLNALFRFAIYLSTLLCMYHKSSSYSYIAVGAGLFTYYVNANKHKATTVVEEVAKKVHVETLENQPAACTKPSLDNPFMNVTMKDYLNTVNGQIVDRPPACDTSDAENKKTMDEYFNNNLYRDVNDVFGKMNSQRQFYTMPSTTIPNHQDEFARWLYLNPKTCKEDQDFCLRYEDVRAKRPVFVDAEVNPVATRKVEAA
jgi:hypothetical protein